MAAVAARLNERFAQGGPSRDASAVGVVVHQFDGVHFYELLQATVLRDFSDHKDRGLDHSCHEGACQAKGHVQQSNPWLPCPQDTWCSKYADRFSASVVNRRLPHLLSSFIPGLVLKPAAVAASLLCGWANDGHTNSGRLTCIPSDE